MTIALYCLSALIVLPYLLAAAGGFSKQRQLGKIDNHDPREQIAQLNQAGKRLYAAQQNAWEALAVFSATILICFIAGYQGPAFDTACAVFLLTRLLHPFLYIYGLATLRSIDVIIGWASCLFLIYQALSL